MVERRVNTIDQLIEFIYRYIANSKITIKDIEKQAGIQVGTLSRWKKKTSSPNFQSLINVLNCLDVDFVLKSPEDSQGKSIEQAIYNSNELIEFIYWCIDYTGMNVGKVEKRAGMSAGSFARWNRKLNIPDFRKLMNVFISLNIDVILKVDFSEEEFVNSEIFACVKAIISSAMSLNDRKLLLGELERYRR